MNGNNTPIGEEIYECGSKTVTIAMNAAERIPISICSFGFGIALVLCGGSVIVETP